MIPNVKCGSHKLSWHFWSQTSWNPKLTLLAFATHELKTLPMQVLGFYSSTAKQVQGRKCTGSWDVIKDGCTTKTNSLNRWPHLIWLTTGWWRKITISCRFFDFNELVVDITEMNLTTKHHITAKKLLLQRSSVVTETEFHSSDLQNLISNAIEYTPR